MNHTQYDARGWDTFLDLGFDQRIEVVTGFEDTGPKRFGGQSVSFELVFTL